MRRIRLDRSYVASTKKVTFSCSDLVHERTFKPLVRIKDKNIESNQNNHHQPVLPLSADKAYD
jgi:hypothetical protein